MLYIIKAVNPHRSRTEWLDSKGHVVSLAQVFVWEIKAGNDKVIASACSPACAETQKREQSVPEEK